MNNETHDIMDGPKHLFVNGRHVEDLDVKKTFARVLLKGAQAEKPVPFEAIVWQSDDWRDA